MAGVLGLVDVYTVRDGAPNRKLLLSAASSGLLERKRGKRQHAVFKTGAFHSG